MRKAVRTVESPRGIWRQELSATVTTIKANNLTRDLRNVPL